MPTTCRICGSPLTQLRRGRPRVVHRGECASTARRLTSAEWRANGPKTRRCEVCASELPWNSWLLSILLAPVSTNGSERR
jgi:hypothetical protein